MKIIAIAAVFLSAALAWPQDQADEPKPDAPIQDNSFLIEEAYNQEAGVVQHISTFLRSRDSGDWLYTFTQEWPVRGLKHQLSFTLPIQALHAGPSAKSGLGDLALNYRFQLHGDGQSRLAVSPRLSLLAPTGNESNGLGTGSLGIQVNLPVSVVVGKRWVTHWNAGATYTPSARSPDADEASTTGYNLGQSVIWLASRRVNLMVETSWTRSQAVVGAGSTEWNTTFFVNPGIRWSHNFASGLQIVPGLAFPIGVGSSKGESGIFLYVSFEHPFGKQAR